VPVSRERSIDIERLSARPEFEVFRAVALVDCRHGSILALSGTLHHHRNCVILRGNVNSGRRMSEGFWPVVFIIVGIIVWVLAKVVANVRKSERQWREVDKSKLKEWQDDDEW
jgi:hypothetical protein